MENTDNDLVVEQKDSEDVLVEIMESYEISHWTQIKLLK